LVDYPNPWIYKGEPLTDEMTKGFFGFVYLITSPDGRKYIGRKYLASRRKQKGKIRRVKKDSGWKAYYSSSDELKTEIEKLGEDNFKREVLHLCRTKGETNFLEIEEQFKRDVLRRDDYFNDQINGKWFKKNVMGYTR
jgi:hypothetical protein